MLSETNNPGKLMNLMTSIIKTGDVVSASLKDRNYLLGRRRVPNVFIFLSAKRHYVNQQQSPTSNVPGTLNGGPRQ